MTLDLNNKLALVCGSSQGIGRAAAVALAELDATVVLCARNGQTLEQVKQELATNKGQAHQIIVADFDDPNKLKQRINRFVTNDTVVHILVNNTGGPPGGPAHKASPEEFTAAFSRHLICNQILARALLPGMKAMSFGRIINVISTSVKQPIPGLGVSNTIRGAVANWAKTLAGEVAPFGITVNNVLPGATNTARLKSIIENKAESTQQSVTAVADKMRSTIPAGRFAEPDEIGAAIAFLASPSAGYITGINLPVDGGRTSCL